MSNVAEIEKGSEQEKVINLFQFIKELNRIKLKEVKNIRDYNWHLMLSDIPDDKDNIKLFYRDRVEDNISAPDDTILSVHKPSFTKCPDPDESLLKWLETGWDNHRLSVKVKESIRIPVSVNNLETDDSEEQPQFSVIRFDEDEARVKLYSEWLKKRESWADLQRLRERTRRIFDDLYAWYYDIKRDSETLEIVSANGFLSDKTDSSIYHPLITHRCRIEFNADENTVYICDSDYQSELQSSLLQSMSDINLDAINGLMDDLLKNDYHPLDRNDLPGFLKVLVHQLSSDSVFSADGIPEDWQRNGRLLMQFQPCFIVRKRLSGILKAIEKIIEDVAEKGLIPAPISDIVSGGTIDIPEILDEESLVEQLASVGGESVDVLLSKEANKEQLEIAKRIENYNAVLVQGPPGTGKTHTIANLMGHFLAQGKSVLVTSYTTKALSVLKDKVVPGLQSLCVSMTDDSNIDMEKSVDGITAYMSKTTSFEMSKQMMNLQEERKEVMAKLAEIRNKIFTIINNENECISYNGESFSPIEVARFVAENEDTLSYIPGRVRPNTALPLTYRQLSDLYRSNELISQEIENELDCDLPNPESVMSPTEFSDICNAIIEAKNRIESLSKLISLNVSCNELTGEVSFGHSFSVVDYSIDDVMALLDHCEGMEDVKEWMKHAAVDGKNGGAYKNRWDQLINEIKKTCELGERKVSEQINYRVNYASESDLLSYKPVLIELSQIYETKGKVSKLSMAVHKQYDKALSTVTVNDHKINSLSDCSAVIHVIEYLEQKHLCERYWNELLGCYDVPQFGDLDSNEPERIAFNWIGIIERYLSWYSQIFGAVLGLLDKIGISNKAIFPISELDSEVLATEKYLNISKNIVPVVCKILISASALYQNIRLLSEKKRVFVSDKRNSSEICSECASAISELNSDRYSDAYGRLASLYEKYALLSQREEMINELEAVATEWANAIKDRNGIHGGVAVPQTIEDAWKWKQFSIIVDDYLSNPFSELQKESVALSKEYRRLTAEYAEKSGWYHLLKRTEADIDMKQALQGWMMTVKRIGKGTGKQAPALKAKARELMAKCQSAVPGWIMPINKALESLDPRVNRFDIIIIDEASQADISSLAILYMGKKLIIVGDDKQVSPMAIGTEVDKISALEQMYIKDKIPNSHLYTPKTSIYDIAATTFQPLMLREHFRCVPEIIGFSNILSYDGKIKPLRAASDSSLFPAVVNYRVNNGTRLQDKTNPVEAKTIVAIMMACMEQEEYTGKTMGVISLLGDGQAELIRSLIDAKISAKEIEDRKIICGNSAHFQGDERDVIFLSMVDSSTGEGPLNMQGFGPDDSYRKRYNVAASRARDQLWVVDSLDSSSDLKPGDIRKKLIDYSLNPQSEEIKRETIKNKSDSPFEEEVASYLSLRGYRLEQQWEVGAYRLDMVAICGEKRVAIECDGERYHSGEAKIREDMERQTILERLGWRFIRIRGSEFYRNKEKTMERVISELTALGIEPEDDTVEEINRTSDLLERVKARASVILSEDKDEDPIDSEKVVEFALNNNSVRDLKFHQEPELPKESPRESDLAKSTTRSDDGKPREAKKTSVPTLFKQITLSDLENGGMAEEIKVSDKNDSNYTTNNSEDPIISFLDKNNIQYVDGRNDSGILWIIGGNELKNTLTEASKMNYYFHYSPSGSKATGGKPGWWTKSWNQQK